MTQAASGVSHPTRAMTVAGVMSGTSADGIDVAVVRIVRPTLAAKARTPRGWGTRASAEVGHPPGIKLLAHEAFPYPAELRRKVLAAMNAASISTAELARLNWRLGIAYAEAVQATAKKHKLKLDFVGCHGQTLYHQARAEKYAGRKFACTWQLGEAAAIAGTTGLTVVSNFRPADMFAGGQGAPLVPLLDCVMFTDMKRGRVLQNIGGIANLTAIPAGGYGNQIMAFDSGPGNMVIDWLAQKLFEKKYDRNGALAAKGAVLAAVLQDALQDPYFRLKPPKTAGREQFGEPYAAEFLAACSRISKNKYDALTTATALTAETIAESYRRFVMPKMKGHAVDYIVSGGGAKNKTLMKMLAARLEPMGCAVSKIDAFCMPAAAKEAAAFALLAWMTWHGWPGNVPSATGAKRPAILGQITFA
jgi:anhydro-N-acetylmuramic acid kinase